MTSFTAGGKGHRALACLAASEMTPAQLRHAAMPDAGANQRRKFFFITAAMEHAGLIRRADEAFVITPAGRALLAELSAVQPPFRARQEEPA